MVQPSVALSFLADPLAKDTGFLARFLFCEPTSTIGTRFHAKAVLKRDAIDAYSSRIREILDVPLPMDTENRALKPRELPLSPQARDFIIKFADEVEGKQSGGGEFEEIKGVASKAAEHACRIAGVLTLFANLNAPCVEAEQMANAITLERYFLSEAVRLSDAAMVSVEIQRADELRRWLLEKWDKPEIVCRDVVRFGPNFIRDTKKAKAAIGVLVSHGWLVPLDPGTEVDGSARKEAWRIVQA
jgi:hypothetical protein